MLICHLYILFDAGYSNLLPRLFTEMFLIIEPSLDPSILSDVCVKQILF